jgi:small conductance mechanosensitive channel
MSDWRNSSLLPRLGLVLLLFWAGSALANPEAEEVLAASISEARSEAEAEVLATAEAEAEQEAAAKAKVEADELRERFDDLHQRRLSKLIEVAALEADAQAAVGEDRLALLAQALESTLEGVDTLDQMWALIEELETAGEDALLQRQALRALLPEIQTVIQADYARQARERIELKAEQAEAGDSEAASALGPVIARKSTVMQRLLSGGLDVAILSDHVDIPSDALRAWLSERAQAHGRLAMSHLRLASAGLDDINLRKAAGDDPAALQPIESAAIAKHASALEGLESIVELMEGLDIDTAAYRRLLIESTGSVTIEAIDREVASELVTRWTADIRKGVEDNGARTGFQLVLFLLIATFFWGLSRFARRIVTRVVEAPHLRFSELLKRMLVSMSGAAVLVVGLLIALSQLGIEVAPMLAGLGIAGFVLGFALQDTLGNFAAGIMILMYRPFDVEDMIDCAGGVFGKVSHMSLVSTTILTIDNKTLIVPNSKIWGDVITNVTAQAIRRVDLEFGIGYGDDIPKAEEVLWSIVNEHPKVLADPEPVIKVHTLGDSSVNFIVRPWVARDDYWDVHWDFTREVKLRFDREGVSIPFPQRDVHVYSTEPTAPAKTKVESRPEANDSTLEIGSTALSAHDEPDSEVNLPEEDD